MFIFVNIVACSDDMAKRKTHTKPLTSSTEDYLEAILSLVREKGFARARDIAQRLSVGRSAVSNALHTLSRAGLVDYQPYRMVTLTDKGLAAAQAVRHRHVELKAFVTDVLGLDDKTADAAACRLEHSVDPSVLRRLSDLAEFIRTNHGQDKTPWRDRFVDFCQARDAAAATAAEHPSPADAPPSTESPATTLADIPPGGTARIVRVGGSKRSQTQLAEAGVSAEAVVSVVASAENVEIQVRGYHLPLSKPEAGQIAVEEL